MVRNVPMSAPQAGYVLASLGLAGAVLLGDLETAKRLVVDLNSCGNNDDALAVVDSIAEAFEILENDDIHDLLHR